MDVQGWITLTNNSGTPYRQRQHPARRRRGRPGQPEPALSRPPPQPPGPLRQAGTESADRERLGDFYLYPLPERTTIANRQTKQVSFLDVARHAGARAPMNIATPGSARRTSRRAPTPCCASRPRATRGSATRCRPAPSASISATRAAIRNSSAKARSATRRWAPSSASTTGQAFDVKVQPVVDSARITEAMAATPATGSSRRLTAERDLSALLADPMRYTLTNARPEPVTVDLDPVAASWWGDTRIVEESLPSERRSRRRGALAGAGARQWRGRRHRHLRHALLSRPMRPGSRAWSRPAARCCAAAPAAAQPIVDLGRARTGSRSPSIAIPAAAPDAAHRSRNG